MGYDPRFAASEENGRLTPTPEPVYQPRLTRTVSVPLITLSPQVAQHQRWSNFQPPELATTLNGTGRVFEFNVYGEIFHLSELNEHIGN